MKRFRIVGLKNLARKVVERLYDFKCFHVTPPNQDPVLKESRLTVGALSNELDERLKKADLLLADIHAALAVLPESGVKGTCAIDFSLIVDDDCLSEESIRNIRSLTGEILELSRRINMLQGELQEAVGYRRMFEEFLPLIEMVASSTNVELVGVTFPKEFADAYDDLEKAMEKVTDGAFSIFRSTEGEGTNSVLVVYLTSFHEEVMRRVIGKKAQPVQLPERYSGDTFAAMLKSLFERERELRVELKEQKEKLDRLARDRQADLHSAIDRIEWGAAPLRAQYLLAHSENSFWLSGWVPEKESARLKESLEREFKDSIFLYIWTPSHEEYEETPVKLQNSFLARPFEKLISIYSLPQYGTVDPTAIMALTFPLFFGLILGDVGYAAVLAAIGYFLKRARPTDAIVGDASFIILLCAGMSAVFGAVYGEFFGEMWKDMGLPHPYYDRKEDPSHFLYLVLFLGCFHVVLGALLGAMNGIKLGSVKKTMEKLGDAVLLASLVWIAYLVENHRDPGWGWAVPVLAFGVKLASGKFVEVILEMPKIIANVLSYSRLMALGLASIIMAGLADEMLKSDMGAVFAVTAAVLLHALNFGIGVFSPAIQSIRLHYVEFFSQFYAPKGAPFSPLERG